MVQYRMMRCDHSLLGGEWLLTDRRRKSEGWEVSEPIYAVFELLEAVRLMELEPLHELLDPRPTQSSTPPATTCSPKSKSISTCSNYTPRFPLHSASIAGTMSSTAGTETITKRQSPSESKAATIATAHPVPGNEHDHFFWTYTEEPHRTRRQAIIKAHPEVRTV